MDWFLRGYAVLFLCLCIGATIQDLRGRKSLKGAVTEAEETVENRLKGAWTWFALVMAFALAIRLWKYGIVPGGMNQDGAMAAVDAKALSDYGTDRFGMFLPVHFTAWGYGQMSVLMSYCMVPFIKLFGLSAVTARLPILIASMAGLAALYGVGKRLMGERGALFLLFFAACDPWHFIQSRWALDCNMFPHMFLIGLWLLLLGTEGKRRHAYFSMIFFALCMYSYGISFYTVPVFLLILGIYLPVRGLLRWRDVLFCILIYFGLAWPIYLTMAINALGGETIRTPFCTIPFFPDSIRSRDILFFSDHKWEQFQNNLSSLLTIYGKGDNLPWNTVPGFGAVTACFLPFAFLGVIVAFVTLFREKDEKRKVAYLAVILFFLIGNLSGVITAWVNVNRINILFYALMLMVGIGMDDTRRNLKKFFWAVPVCLLILSTLFLKTYFTEHAQTLSYYYFEDFIEAVRFAEEKTPCRKLHVTNVVRGNEAASNTAEILTLFALEVDARFFQGETLDENGLSYAEKYQYGVIEEPEEIRSGTAYVITAEDATRELWRDCVLFPVNHYYVAVKE